MEEITFVIPLRVDSADRLENADASVQFLRKHFPRSKVVIVEHAGEPALAHRWARQGLVYRFMPSSGPFSRGAAINEGVIATATRYVCVYDADVLISRPALEKAAKQMDQHRVSVLLPHNTLFVNISGETRKRVIESLGIEGVPFVKSLKQPLPSAEYRAYSIPSGVVLFNRQILLMCGGFNKRMEGYGWEDIEVLKRLNRLGFYYRIFGRYNVVHLDHSRGEGSKPDPIMYQRNHNEYLRIMTMKRADLLTYVSDELRIDSTHTVDQLRSAVTNRRVLNFAQAEPLSYLFRKSLNYVRTRGFIPS